MTLGLTQPLTKINTRIISWGGKGGRCVGYGIGRQAFQAYNLHVPIVLKSGSLNLLEPPGSAQACNGNALPLHGNNGYANASQCYVIRTLPVMFFLNE
jgi:hypothetical protein